ncbi:LD-carboxypeptidase [Aurantiacibacter gangjinensis]|uniref:Carboxypeptidase n=1 Tax=Aurantiacibacter gangjinensis TaxID=502682 RepID=A0A0G9MTS5_9SPHN|nr:LD-carboxypeptidase [Aurantiacibacter gangjinensis]APE28499.1 Muramoyltetrapeptide carboxypeptidase [Aurantiacibacter gangjinensis]KLE32703.1 carboxypeptidase [Aurantiacibacter gangjinensis]
MRTRIACLCPGKPIRRERADAVLAIAQAEFPDVTLTFHPQCFMHEGHFAGDDATRREALVATANDPAVDAIWFAMGGYGSNRIAADAIAQMQDAARTKTYLGYSDAGTLLGALYRHGIGKPVHGPLAGDIKREGGADAVRRVLGYLTGQEVALENGLDDRPTVAFNLMTLAMLVGTDLMPDLTGHVVCVEEVAEHLYAVDRLFFHVTAHLKGAAGLRLGRISAVPENDRPFGMEAEDIARFWCERTGIPYLGRADIGHDAENAIIPFGVAQRGKGA